MEDRIISSLSLPPLADTVVSSQSSDQELTQPSFGPESPCHIPLEVEHECEVNDFDDHSEEIMSGPEEAVSTEHPNDSPRANNGEGEGRNFDIEITEAIKHLESKIPPQVTTPLQVDKATVANFVGKDEESEIVISEASEASISVTTEQSKKQISKVPLKKVTLPLEPTRSTKEGQKSR